MSDFEDLLGKLLEQKPELGRADVEDRIRQKKDKIGAGYLTDQGALFLIASDLGIELAEPLKVEMGLKGLYSGAKEISLETRLLNMSPPKQYSRKDGTPFMLRTMTVYDSDARASVKLWDEKANLPGLNELKPGDLIKIIKAYVKNDLDGSPAINVGSGATIEQTDTESSIPSIDSITIDVSEVKEDQKDLVVSGLISGQIGSIQFTNSRGEPGKGLRLGLRGSDGKTTRVVIWGKDESDLPAVIPADSKVRLLGVRTKAGQQGLEIQGNESTMIEADGHEARPVTARIISIVRSSGASLICGADEKKNLLQFSDTAGLTDALSEGDIIECMPSKSHGNSVTLDSTSFVRKMDDSGSIPKEDGLRTKVSDIKIGQSCCIGAVILKAPGRRDIQTRTGKSVMLGEMLVQDDTGEVWVKGWGEEARLLDECAVGEVAFMTNLEARSGLEGRTELFLNRFSKITKRD